MANQEHLDILKQGVEVWNRWREEHPDIQPNLRDAILKEIDLSRANLSGTDLSGADLIGANLRGANLSSANLIRADLSSADLSSADLSGTNLRGANLRGTNFFRANLFRANLIGGAPQIFANGEHRRTIRRSFRLTSPKSVEPPLNGADLSSANLIGANLVGADLIKADLSKANLSGADLSDANLNGAKLIEANLRGAILNRAKLVEADLSDASIGGTIFGALDLRTVKGLKTITHLHPSTIGTDTIVLSHGELPEAFLRGVGLPDTFIAYARSLVQAAIEYYTCFISYSSKDQDFAERLYADLQSNGVRCWFAPEDLKIGEKFWHRIDESIKLYDKLLVVLSQQSVESEWVEREVMAALEKERQQRKLVLFPITLDKAFKQTNAPWAADIRRSRHTGNFIRWKQHDDYQKAFDRLLRDLKA